MNWKALSAIAAATLLVLMVLGRYEIIGVSPGGEGVIGVAYRLDRWTGDVAWMQGTRGGSVELK